MPAADTDGQQANDTRLYRSVLRTLKEKRSRAGDGEGVCCFVRQAHPRGVAAWGPDHRKASRNHFAGGGSHLPFVKTTSVKRDKAG